MAGSDLFTGSLDLLILKALSWGPRHGYAVGRWIRDTTEQELLVQEGALYPALHRLEKRGMLSEEWGVTDTNREAKFYRLTASGRRRFRDETERWNRFARLMHLALEASGPRTDMARPFRLPDDPRRAGADVESEIRLHIELRAKEYEAQGMAPEEALEAALVSFGDRESVARECVSVRGGTLRARQRHAWLAEVAQDVRSAVRGLIRSPGFALVAVLTLTLGIGANTALFSVARSVLFRPLPYPDSDRLVQVWTDERAKGRESPEWLTPPDFDDWRAQNATLAGMAAFQGWGPDLTGDGEPTSLAGLAVTGGFFDVLGVRPVLGRLFVDADDDAGAERVAVIADGLWRLRFGADPAIIGRSVTLSGEPWTVVGILPATYRPPVPFPPEIYRPMRRPLNSGCDRNCIVLRAIGRMRPGVTLAQAEADLDAIAGRLAADYPRSNQDRGAWLVPLHEQLTGPVRPALAMLGAAAGFVLLVGCVNLATLLLVRGAARRRELAMRAALGAGRGRLVRQQLTEGLVLAGVGGALGLLIAWLASGAVARLVPESVRQVQAVGIDAGVVGFAIVLTLLSGGLFAAVPAFAAVRRNLFSTLRATDQGDEAHGRRLRAGLVVAELALAVMLLVGAGLMLRSLLRLGQIDLGFRTNGLVVVPVRFPPARYSAAARAVAAMEDVVARVGASRAVRAVALTDVPPLQGGGDQDVSLAAVGEPAPEGSRSIWYRSVSPNYLDVMGMRIVSGRGFGPCADQAGSAVVGIINEETARRYWRGKDPVGRELAGGGMNILIVGVVANGRPDGPNQPTKTELFLPIGQIPTGGVTFLLDPADGEAAAIAALRAGLAAVDPLIPIGPPELLGRQLDATVAQPRLYATLVGALAAVALGLAALGVFGVMAYSVALRRREIGVRLALGAGPGNIHRLILRDGIRLAIVGGVVGLVGAAALSRLLGALLFEVSPLDPLAYGGAALILGLVAVGAAWLPARRAMGVDPLLAMRQE